MERTTKPEIKPLVNLTNPVSETVTIDKEIPLYYNYKKLGGGSFRFKIDGRDRIIKPNEIFKARPEDIPAAFKDSLQLLDKVTQAPKTKVITSVYTITSEDEENWYVIDSLGKKVNEKPLTKESAYTMVKDLER